MVSLAPQGTPVLVGFNADERALFLPRALPHQTAAQYQIAAKVFFASDQTAIKLYLGNTDKEATKSANSLIGDLVIRQQTWEALDRQASSSGKPYYGYYFTYTSEYSPQPIQTAEINFVFGNLGQIPSSATHCHRRRKMLN